MAKRGQRRGSRKWGQRPAPGALRTRTAVTAIEPQLFDASPIRTQTPKSKPRPVSNAWRRHAEWMTAEEFAIVAEAMAKQIR